MIREPIWILRSEFGETIPPQAIAWQYRFCIVSQMMSLRL